MDCGSTREDQGSNPTTATFCPSGRDFTIPKVLVNTLVAVDLSQNDLKEWDYELLNALDKKEI